MKERNTYLDIRIKTWKSIAYVMWIVLVGLITLREIDIHTPQPVLLHSPLAVRAAYADYSYQIPTLNPNVEEREQNKALIKKIWGNDNWVGLNIARCESGYRTHSFHRNTDGTVDEGVFQANSVHGMPEMQNAVANISYAYTLYLNQGTRPWDSSKSCWSAVLADK